MTHHQGNGRDTPLRVLRDDAPSVGGTGTDEQTTLSLGSATRAAWATSAVDSRRSPVSTEIASPAAIGLPLHSTPVPDLQAIIDEHERAATTTHHFRPSRLILINCWVYGYQEFPFVDGHLVLNGGNGSGKTTALTAAMPVALFGTTAPGALDTMDGRARTLEYLVLGDSEDVRDKLYIETGRSTHVLWEFYQASTGRYVTVGQIFTGSRAGSGGRAATIEKRGLVIRDGRRVGKTLRTWSFDDNGAMQPWDALNVASNLVDLDAPSERRNVITDTSEEFRRTVAREIFGTENIREVVAYERTLRAMRRPMLNNKEFRPSDVADMLRQSLPELDAAIIDQLDSSLSGLDRIRAQLANLQTELAATAELRAAHEDLLQARGTELARHLALYEQIVRGLLTNIESEETKKRELQQSRQGLLDRITKGASEIAAIDKTLGLLRQERGAKLAVEHQSAVARREEAWKAVRTAEERCARALRGVERAREVEVDAITSRHSALMHVSAHAERLQSAAQAQRWDLGREAARVLVERCASRADEDTLPNVAARETPAASREAASERGKALRALEAATRAFVKVDEEYRRQQGAIEPLSESVSTAEQRHKKAMTDRDMGRDAAAEVLLRWHSEFQAILPSGLDIDRVARIVRRVEDASVDLRQLMSKIHADVRDEAGRRIAAKQDAVNERSERARELADASRRLDEQRRQKDLPPALSVERQAVRDALLEAEIDAVPLYAVLELAPDAKLDEMARLEQVLTDTALLSALVIAPKDAVYAKDILDQAFGVGGADQWLLPTRADGVPPTHPATYLIAADTSPAAQYARDVVLSRIHCTPQAAWPTETPAEILLVDIATGAWRYGMTEGRSASERSAPQYIGLVNRQAERARRIAALEQECEDLTRTIRRHDAHLLTLQQVIDAVKRSQSALDELSEIGRLPELIANVRTRAAEVDEALRNLREADGRIQHLVRVRQECNEARAERALDLPEFRESSLEDLAVAISASAQWLELADDWGRQWVVLTRAFKLVGDTREAAERAQVEYDEHRETLASAERDAASLVDLIAELERQLDSDEVRSLQQRLADLETRRSTTNEAVVKDTREEAQIEPKVIACNEVVAKYTGQLREPQEMRDAALLAFIGFIRTHAPLFPKAASDLIAFPDLATTKIADALRIQAAQDAYRAAIRNFGTTNVSHRSLQDTATEREAKRDIFSNAFQTRRVHLESYDIEWMLATYVVTSTVGTTRLTSLAALEQHLTHHVEAQQAAIEQQEDDLYRRVFLEKLSDGLRNQIRETRVTVSQLNDVLVHRPLHDGEVLSVVWRPLTISRRRGKDREGDLWSTEEDVARRKEVVNILTTRDLQNASDEAQEMVYQYFRGRLNTLREKYGRPGEKPGFTRLDGREVRSFRDVLATAFDYRQWYEFGIMSQMPNVAHPQEITDERFPRRSGGQRVSATLVPLLAALEVRCRAFGATSPSPRFIALDEAFAGVDEENTEALFQTLEAFDMSWIMTSDKLTGASPALTGSMTAVLTKRVRSDAPSVVATHYLVWDGTFEFDAETAVLRTAMIRDRATAEDAAPASS